jgi:hypothetical protein
MSGTSEIAASPAVQVGLAALDAAVVEQVVIGGDLARLAPAERVSYYRAVCESLGLNPLTQPFEYIRLNDKLRLYAKREATDQLRRIYNISVEIAAREQQSDLYVVTARATTADGRTDEAVGAVSLSGLSGANLANAIMKAETKAKRRVTLSICGLGWMDESEVDSVRVARRVTVREDGEVLEATHTQDVKDAQEPSVDLRASDAIQPLHGRTPALTHQVDAATRREKLLRRWETLRAEADALGITYDPLPSSPSDDTIVNRGIALRHAVDAARTGRAA